jgi:hypothetical protein
MHLSGLVLDVYDDCSGSSLKSIYPTKEEIPVIVKTAHALTGDEHDALPDDVFALVLDNGDGTILRKYACIDPGNTLLSIAYFLQNKDKLPIEAQKVAAANLIKACDWYSLAPSADLAKCAGLGSVLKPVMGMAGSLVPGMSAAMGAKDTAAGIGSAIQRAHQSRGLIDPNLIKAGEVSGTHLMPLQESLDKGSPKYKTTVKKTSSVGHLVQGKERHAQGEQDEVLEQNRLHKEKNPPSLQQKQLVPYVNVQGAEPPSPTKMKVSHYALRGHYPLDSYAQVKCAAAYFDTYWKLFAPADRHEYCINMVKQADALRIPVSDMARKYGASGYAPAEEIAIALETRASLLPDGRQLLDKLASAYSTVDPEVFALALSEFDKQAGLHHHYDRDVMDPFYSTFGMKKEAEYSFCIGSDYVNESCLKRLAVSGYALLKKRFGEDMADEFQKDPVGIFDSMPLEQKKIISRLALDPQPTCGNS